MSGRRRIGDLLYRCVESSISTAKRMLPRRRDSIVAFLARLLVKFRCRSHPIRLS